MQCEKKKKKSRLREKGKNTEDRGEGIIEPEACTLPQQKKKSYHNTKKNH
jgi:hypothetical protein